MDHDAKFCPLFRRTTQAGKVRPLKLPARRPNLTIGMNSSRSGWGCCDCSTIVSSGEEYAPGQRGVGAVAALRAGLKWVEGDLKQNKVVSRWPVAPGGKPVGMAMDRQRRLLYIGCRDPQK